MPTRGQSLHVFTSARGITNSHKQLHKGWFALIKLPWCTGRTNKRKNRNCQPSFHISDVERRGRLKLAWTWTPGGVGADGSETEVPGLLVRERGTKQTAIAIKLLMLVAFSFSSRLGTCLFCTDNLFSASMNISYITTNALGRGGGGKIARTCSKQCQFRYSNRILLFACNEIYRRSRHCL